MANHPNRKQRPALHPEFAQVRPTSDTPDAEARADVLTAAREAAVLPWRWLAIDAKSAVDTCEQNVTDAESLVDRLRRELAAAETVLIAARAECENRLPALQRAAQLAAQDLDRARCAVLDASGASVRWRVARSGRIVSHTGIDLQRADHVARCELTLLET